MLMQMEVTWRSHPILTWTPGKIRVPLFLVQHIYVSSSAVKKSFFSLVRSVSVNADIFTTRDKIKRILGECFY